MLSLLLLGSTIPSYSSTAYCPGPDYFNPREKAPASAL
jgi:hypothetical protein